MGSRLTADTNPAVGGPGARRTRRHDPNRRDRIVDACLDVIAEYGVSGTTHRRVAAAADVPLGSMTYHFAGMDELLREAFGRFAHSAAAQFERQMSHARTSEDAVREIAMLIGLHAFTPQRDLVLAHELYTLAAREPAFRTLTNEWMHRSRDALGRHFDPATCRALDAFIEGATIHRALDTEPPDGIGILDAIRRLAQIPAPREQ